MTTQQINLMTDEFFDSELTKNKEPILFTHLSLDEDAREYFKMMNKIKGAVQDSIHEFPDELESRILYSIAETDKRKFKLPFTTNFPVLFSYSLAIILLVISILFYSRSNSYKEMLETKTIQVSQQNQLIELLMNSLPPAEVRAEYTNKVLVRSN